MGDVVSNVVNAITKGIQWIRAQYRQFKVWLAEQLIAALAEGWKAALLIAGLVMASIVVGYVWQILMNNAIVIAVKGFFDTVGGFVAQLAAFLQVDMIIALVQLGIMVNDKLYEKLAPLYDELGSLAQELELDFNYISTFLEVDRAILQATYSFTGFGFVKADAEYVKGLQEWLKKLGKRMSDYAANPQQIFTDIQSAITSARIKEANDAVAKIWAAIDFSGDWIRKKGEILFSLAKDIDAAVKAMPENIQEAIKPWYNDAVAKIRTFEEEKWNPFWNEYVTFTDRINETFLAFGMNIEEIQRRINDPLDWLRTLLAMDPEEGATLKSTLAQFFGSLMPVKENKEASTAVAVVNAFYGVGNDIQEAIAEVEALESKGKPDPLSEEPSPVVIMPWYEKES